MKKKNPLSIKWMLVIMFALASIVYLSHQASENIALSSRSNHYSSPKNFFEFLEDLLGIERWGNSSTPHANGNNILNTIEAMLGRGHFNTAGDTSAGVLPGGTALNLKTTQGTKTNSKQSTNGGNFPSSNIGSLSENNLETNSGNDLENDRGINAENNSEFNAENNPQYNSETSTGQGPENSEYNEENNSGNNTAGNSEANADQGSGNTSEGNSENNADQGSGNVSGENSGGGSESNADQGTGDLTYDNSEGSAGSNSGNGNQANIPTINPIPTDDAASQSVAQQNQQNNTLATLLAARQALVLPVQQQAQASKYQTVNPQNIPPVSTNQAPPDVVAKVKANQVTLTH